MPRIQPIYTSDLHQYASERRFHHPPEQDVSDLPSTDSFKKTKEKPEEKK
jgi:hypothetical protein